MFRQLTCLIAKPIISSFHAPSLSALGCNLRFYTCNKKKHRLFSRNVLFPAWPPPQDRILFFLCENMIFSPLPLRYFPPCLAHFRVDQSTSDVLLLSNISSCSDPPRRISATCRLIIVLYPSDLTIMERRENCTHCVFYIVCY